MEVIFIGRIHVKYLRKHLRTRKRLLGISRIGMMQLLFVCSRKEEIKIFK